MSAIFEEPIEVDTPDGAADEDDPKHDEPYLIKRPPRPSVIVVFDDPLEGLYSD